MKHFSNVILLGSGVLALSLVANAQISGQGSYYPQRDDPYYRNDPNSRYNSRDGYAANDDPLIRRVLSDLAMVARNARTDGHERKHFDEAAEKLQGFQDRWARGKFDRGKLDKAIENLQHLADADQIRGRDRDLLDRDMEDLRQFRASGGRYNSYGDGPYRDDRYNQNRRYDQNRRYERN